MQALPIRCSALPFQCLALSLRRSSEQNGEIQGLLVMTLYFIVMVD